MTAVDWAQEFAAARMATVEVLSNLDHAALARQVHSEFSPLGWHYGHVAYTEALWLLVEDGGGRMPRPDLAKVFAVDGLDKAARGDALPPRAEIDAYAAEIRAAVSDRIAAGAPDRNPRLWHFLLQHESQHCETMTMIRWLTGASASPAGGTAPGTESVAIPGQSYAMGADGAHVLDNESDSHLIDVGAFAIDRDPVSQGAFRAFIEFGGYRTADWWSAEGWAWRGENQIDRPRHWQDGGDALPVMGVSYHEAEAYCRFAGARLPTEAEWELAARWDPASGAVRPVMEDDLGTAHHDRRFDGPARLGRQAAAGCRDMLGNVWEWTASRFAPYPGFAPWPYEGYSAAYFDGRHRVVRGGSWATRGPVLRSTFRNWYMPNIREIFVGFRCIRDSV